MSEQGIKGKKWQMLLGLRETYYKVQEKCYNICYMDIYVNTKKALLHVSNVFLSSYFLHTRCDIKPDHFIEMVLSLELLVIHEIKGSLDFFTINQEQKKCIFGYDKVKKKL